MDVEKNKKLLKVASTMVGLGNSLLRSLDAELKGLENDLKKKPKKTVKKKAVKRKK